MAKSPRKPSQMPKTGKATTKAEYDKKPFFKGGPAALTKELMGKKK
jgi:hypothetical protein